MLVQGAASIIDPMSETIWCLKRCPLFERLSPISRRSAGRTLLRRAHSSVRRSFISPPIRAVPFESLARGRVKIKAISSDGRETIFAFIEPAGVFGELAVVDGEKRNEFAEDRRRLAGAVGAP